MDVIERTVESRDELIGLLNSKKKSQLSDYEMEHLFWNRKLLLEERCRGAGFGRQLNPDVFGIQFDFKFVWCPLPSTYPPTFAYDFLFKQVVYQPSVKVHLTRDGAELLNDSLTEGYVTVMIVREPFHRLVDAHLKQIQSSTEEEDRKIKCDILGLPYSSSNPAECHPTFSNFVDFIILQVSQSRKLNEFWVPYHMYCSVCALKWNYIIHYENLEFEENFFLRKVCKPSPLKMKCGLRL